MELVEMQMKDLCKKNVRMQLKDGLENVRNVVKRWFRKCKECG